MYFTLSNLLAALLGFFFSFIFLRWSGCCLCNVGKEERGTSSSSYEWWWETMIFCLVFFFFSLNCSLYGSFDDDHFYLWWWFSFFGYLYLIKNSQATTTKKKKWRKDGGSYRSIDHARLHCAEFCPKAYQCKITTVTTTKKCRARQLT